MKFQKQMLMVFQLLIMVLSIGCSSFTAKQKNVEYAEKNVTKNIEEQEKQPQLDVISPISKEECEKQCKKYLQALIIPSGVCKTGYICEYKNDSCTIEYVTQNVKECTDIIMPEPCSWDEKLQICT